MTTRSVQTGGRTDARRANAGTRAQGVTGRGVHRVADVRTIDWGAEGAVVIVDQTLLPHEVRLLRLTEVDELVDAIRRLAVRGAPALGAAGALGVLLAVRQARRDARPTAVNLAWGVDRAVARIGEGESGVERAARTVLDEDVAANRAMGE